MNFFNDQSNLEGQTASSSTETIRLIRKLADLLPPQGPITAFAFLNPLQGMEAMPFFDALKLVGDHFGCEPFLLESEYRSKLAEGRITTNELIEILKEESSSDDEKKIAGLIRISDLRLSFLQHSINPATDLEIKWEISKFNAIRRFRSDISHGNRELLVDSTRDWINNNFQLGKAVSPSITRDMLTAEVQDSLTQIASGTTTGTDETSWEAISLSMLWCIIKSRMASVPTVPDANPMSLRHRDLLIATTQKDSDELVHPILGRFCSVYLDQGYAHWRLPQRENGFFQSFLSLFSNGGHVDQKWLRPVSKEARRLRDSNTTAIESIEESLQILGVGADEKEPFLMRSLLALRGWAGMIWQTETRPDRVYISSPEGTIFDFIAVRLILERFALQWLARESFGFTGTLDKLRDFLRDKTTVGPSSPSIAQRAYPILQLSQLHGWTPTMLAELPEADWHELIDSAESFTEFERRRVFHLAFERRVLHQALDTISARADMPLSKPKSPRLQVFTCIDAREESFRRHLEEVSPGVETFGNAGFFNVPMYFKGSADAHFTALCPIVIKPQHWIVEDVVHSLADAGRQRANIRRWLGNAAHHFYAGTRGSITGAILTAVIGPLFTIPLIGRTIFPRLTAKMHRTARGLVAPPSVTRLRLERPEQTPPGPNDDGIGFTLSEMVTMGERALRDTGLTTNFARLVIILGHGSNCLNNPHESAYHCGACSGSPGAPNARALAAILNDIRVRKRLESNGVSIPEETHFLGGLHNTATEEISYFDLELLPSSHVRDLRDAMNIFSHVAERNAHERCRRYETARLEMSPAESLKHVEDRSEDLAQTRPEYGNSTNAVCFVGRRSRVRGLYLDRRSFLMSYDAAQDTEQSMILARILAAVIPVCEGINMLYTLSAIDNRGWGCGTKLPHNVTSLLGVMDGAASDLRPGLPWQGVDIHEPVRLLFVIESTPKALLKIMDDNPVVAKICRNGWAQLSVLDPATNRIQLFVNGEFTDYKPANVTIEESPTSFAWYRGHRENLPFALIKSENT